MPIMESTTEEREVLSSKKRKRVEHNSPHNSGSLALEKLRWSRVAFPERFEDAEGFFGLEEVSNVEVLRDPKFGRLEYRVSKIHRKSLFALLMNLVSLKDQEAPDSQYQ